jgi:hypothetical protein
MPMPDARTRNKISLTPSKVLSTSYVVNNISQNMLMQMKSCHSIPSRHIPNILLSNVLYVFALHAGKEWLLDLNIGVFWLVMRVLACAGLGVLIWEGVTGQVKKRKTINIEVSVPGYILRCSFWQLPHRSGQSWACRHCCSFFNKHVCSRRCLGFHRLGMGMASSLNPRLFR